MKYSKKLFVNYQHIDSNLKLNNLSILSLFQDIVFEYAKNINDGLLHSDHRWFVIAYHVIINDRPSIEDDIELRTWSSNMRGFIGSREFEILKDDKVVIKALTNLTRFNIQENHIERLTQELFDRYNTDPSQTVFDSYQVEKIAVPDEFDYKLKFTVPHYFIDANNHVNNIFFYEIANQILLENIGTNFVCNEFIIHYKEQIKEHENIVICMKNNPNDYVVVIKDEKEEIIKSIVMFKK